MDKAADDGCGEQQKMCKPSGLGSVDMVKPSIWPDGGIGRRT